MSKFDIGDKVYYIETDYISLAAIAKSCNATGEQTSKKYPNPFIIVAVKEIRAKYHWDTRIANYILYDLVPNDKGSSTIIEDIEESEIFLSFDECLVVAKMLTESGLRVGQ